MKISHLILFGFLLILALFSITTYINFKQSEEARDNAEYVSRSNMIIRQSNRFQRNILNMISGLRGYLFSGQDYFKQVYDSAAKENEIILRDLNSFVEEKSSQRIALDQIISLNNRWLNEFANPLLEAKQFAGTSAGGTDEFNKLYLKMIVSGEEKLINRELQEKFKSFTNHQYQVNEESKAVLAASIQETKHLSIYLTAFSIVCGLVVAGYLTHRIGGRISSMVKMANQIATGEYDVSVPVKGKDELNLLGRSLNNMAKVLAGNIALLQRKNEELDQFAHIVSHDMKAPLRGIDNVVNWMEEDHAQQMSPEMREYIRLIKGRLQKGEALIEGILSYSKVANMKREKEMVSTAELVREVLESIPVSASFRFDVAPDMPFFLTEKIPLFQVFSNVINNAVKYQNKENGTVTIGHREFNDHYEFFVKDNGPGIAEKHHQRIFQMFQTLGEKDTAESTGVGLAIVKKILDDRNEKISVQSAPGEGAVFSFTWKK